MPERNITEMLQEVAVGNQQAEQQLIAVVYDDLRRLASRYLSGERPGHMLQTTALVNETYLKLFGNADPLRVNNSGHFFAVVATQMRHILVDHARGSLAGKRAGIHINLEEACHVSNERSRDLVALDDALKELEGVDGDAAKVVELRFFGGYTNEETARIMQTNVARIRRDWEFARAWLYDRLGA